VKPFYLLDTNILSAAIRSPEGALGLKLVSKGIDRMATSILVAAELRYGVAKRGASSLARRVERALGAITVLPFDDKASQAYGPMRASLERMGQPIGAAHMFIAAHALSIGAVLVTANEREFRRVPGLSVENWL
jgi:tRNA(fMet)-specific endonuclease VapC